MRLITSKLQDTSTANIETFWDDINSMTISYHYQLHCNGCSPGYSLYLSWNRTLEEVQWYRLLCHPSNSIWALKATQRIQPNQGKFCANIKQVVKVIWHNAASPPYTDGSVVFIRLWPHLVLPNRYPHRIAAAPAESLCILTAGHIQACPFHSHNCSFTCGDLDSSSNAWFLGPTWVHTQMESRSVQPFSQGSQTDWQTNRQTTLLCLQQQATSSQCCDAT